MTNNQQKGSMCMFVLGFVLVAVAFVWLNIAKLSGLFKV
jgi:hypothetical protein